MRLCENDSPGHSFNSRPGTAFSITRPGRGGGGSLRPPGVSKLSVAVREKIQIDCPRRVLAIGGIFFYPRSTFDLVMTGHRSIFGEIDVFQINKTIATQLWQISPNNFYHRVRWTIGIILMYNLLLLYGSCRCITPGRPPGHVRR